MNKWNDKTYHILECMRELSSAEEHIIHYISQKENNTKLNEILSLIREIRKKIESKVLG